MRKLTRQKPSQVDKPRISALPEPNQADHIYEGVAYMNPAFDSMKSPPAVNCFYAEVDDNLSFR